MAKWMIARTRTKGEANKRYQEILKASAAEQAYDVIIFDLGLTVVSPDTWDAAALEMVMKGQIAHGSVGRFVAFYDPKADEDARVHPGQNAFLRCPPSTPTA